MKFKNIVLSDLSRTKIYKTVIEDAVEAPKKLIEQANKLGGYDNITVITIL